MAKETSKEPFNNPHISNVYSEEATTEAQLGYNSLLQNINRIPPAHALEMLNTLINTHKKYLQDKRKEHHEAYDYYEGAKERLEDMLKEGSL